MEGGWVWVHVGGLAEKGREVIVGQIIRKLVADAGEVHRDQLKLKEGFNEKQAPEQMHEWGVTT